MYLPYTWLAPKGSCRLYSGNQCLSRCPSVCTQVRPVRRHHHKLLHKNKQAISACRYICKCVQQTYRLCNLTFLISQPGTGVCEIEIEAGQWPSAILKIMAETSRPCALGCVHHRYLEICDKNGSYPNFLSSYAVETRCPSQATYFGGGRGWRRERG